MSQELKAGITVILVYDVVKETGNLCYWENMPL